MARSKAIIDGDAIADIARDYLLVNATESLAIYTAEPLELDKSDYPFERHPGERSIRDPASQSITPIAGGIRIQVEARGAQFIEEGNDASGDTIEAYGPEGLAIPIKAGGRLHFENGRLYFVTHSVLAYEGRHLLMNSVRKAFGLFGL